MGECVGRRRRVVVVGVCVGRVVLVGSAAGVGTLLAHLEHRLLFWGLRLLGLKLQLCLRQIFLVNVYIHVVERKCNIKGRNINIVILGVCLIEKF